MSSLKIQSSIESIYQAGHKYLFSDSLLPWTDAVDECKLYGGWLVSLDNLKEQNCLLRYGMSQGFDAWYWHDGMH